MAPFETAFYPGTFNPVHQGHLIIAEAARSQFGLKQVVFIPAGEPPWKSAESDLAPTEARLAMLGLAIAGNPAFTIDRLEVEREGPSYTADTLRVLKEKYGFGDRPVPLIIGMDALGGVNRWHDPAYIIENTLFLQAPRPGCTPVQELMMTDRFWPLETQIIDMPEIAISSTDIRRRLAAGRSIRYLAPEPVREYLSERALYPTPVNKS